MYVTCWHCGKFNHIQYVQSFEMAEDSEFKRRRFLQATGAAALTASVAGCSSDGGDATATDSGDGGDGSDGGDGGDDGTATPESFDGLDAYPYSANETDVQSAIEVMEEAGYGPDNTFELDWLQYTSPTWLEMANTIRSRLQQAHIEMNISEASFSELLSTTEQGDHEAYTLGWIADYPAPQNFLQLINPQNTVYDAEGTTPNGARLFWSEDAMVDSSVTQYMEDGYSMITSNPGTSDEAQQARDDAVPMMEEALWESAALIPLYSSVTESMWYDYVDFNPAGGMGPSRAKTNNSVNAIEGRDRLSGTSATLSTLDPVASGDTASGAKIMNMFDAPLNYFNGEAQVSNLLVEDYELSDDLTTYTFTLKEGVQFHEDYGEVTAADMVYSLRRLAESSNSSNSSFLTGDLNVVREENDNGEVVPESMAIEQTGDYEFTMELEEPFAYALEIMAYSAFSAVPEGIVGDIEGYEGEMGYEEFSLNNPIGSGPFQFVEWNSGNGGNFTYDTFDDYHGEPASFDGIDLQILTDTNAIFNRFINGNADTGGVPTSQYDPDLVSIEETQGAQELGTYGPVEENDVTYQYARTPTINTFYVGFNLEEVPQPVREAMAYVINREQFVQEVFLSRGSPSYHLTPAPIYPGGGETYRSHWQGN